MISSSYYHSHITYRRKATIVLLSHRTTFDSVAIHNQDELQTGTDAVIGGGCSWSNNPVDVRSAVSSSDIIQTITEDPER